MKKIFMCIALLNLLNTLNAQWFWQNPLPQGNRLTAVKFISADIGWAVGLYGTIIKTTDGGVNWTSQYSESTMDLFSVSFSDQNHGTVVGLGGTILRTTNGGNTWILQNSGTTTELHGVCFSDNNTGTAVGESGLILRTTDGGLNWSPQTSGTTAALYNVFLIDENIGTAVGAGTVLRTTNGGTSWSPQSIGNFDYLLGVSFLDADNGTTVGENGDIYHTTDGGTTWNFQPGPLSNDLFSVSLIDANNGVAVGINGTIISTTNGGTTWLEQSSGTTKFLRGVSVLNSGNWVTIGDDGIILKTTDSGNTWNFLSSGSANYNLLGLTFTDANNGTAVGFDIPNQLGVILRTTNEGALWTSQLNNYPNTFFSVAFKDENVGMAVSAGGYILRTTNGGSNWAPTSCGSTEDLYGIAYQGGTKWTVITRDSIYRSTDDGISWIQNLNFPTGFHYGVSFVNENTGFIIGFDLDGLILRTDDGGETWTKQPTGLINGSGISFFAASFTDPNTGTVVGELSPADSNMAIIVRTTDGGTNWHLQSSRTVNDLLGVSFVDANTGTAVGRVGTIIRTTNGGTTWNLQSSGTQNSLNSVSFTDANTGTIAGSNGTILKTTNGGVVFVNEETNLKQPNGFLLSQNYPNPFNPSTTISYRLAEAGNVDISIYNIVGQQVAQLVSGYEHAGNYSITWNAQNFASGIYFYKLQTGKFTEAKKMILLK